ncbi:MAG: outer membrane protein assembly factor BamD [Idiomarina sp.]|nr:outer membrane protein assembly factor BamD [Idiomarina sp.]
MKLVVVAAALAFALALSGCSSRSTEQMERSNLEQMYDTAQMYLDSGRYTDAANLLTQINSRFPFGAYTQQVQLDLIYALYKTGNQDRALSSIDRFLQLNPNHADNDYVRYMRALVYQQAEGSVIQDLLGVDRDDRNPYYAERAFEEFQELLRLFPNSMYAPDARARMLGISGRLARHELGVAEYYLRREAYAAAANRARYIVETHPHVVEQERALEIMVESYTALGLERQAEDARNVLQLNFRSAQR